MTATATQPGAWIENLRWPEVESRLAAGATVIVPVGARAKEHGHHLPMQTDYLYARALCDGIAAELPVLVAPVVDFGYYPAFEHYPGSQHLRAETFIAVIEDLLEGLIRQKARRIAIVNTGVSTKPPIYIAVRNILGKHGVRVAVADIEALGRKNRPDERQKYGGHADEMETSVILSVAPELVDMTKAVEDYGHMLTTPKTVFYRPVVFTGDPTRGPDYSATGVRGDPTFATPEKGRALLAVMIGELVDGLRALEVAE
jgi:creatinine amidohydrolase